MQAAFEVLNTGDTLIRFSSVTSEVLFLDRLRRNRFCAVLGIQIRSSSSQQRDRKIL
jgi:hypothetical protein